MKRLINFWDHSSFSPEISKAERVNLIKKFLNHANVLKLAKEEATLFFEDENPLSISQELSNKPDVIITCLLYTSPSPRDRG